MATKNNYKAKWLAAAATAGKDIPRLASEATEVSETAINASVTASIELNALQNTACELATFAKSLTKTLNDNRYAGGIDYGDVDHNIDSKLGKMPVNVILRRVRDVIKFAEFRVGMLSVACDELTEAGESLAQEIQAMAVQSQSLQRATVDSLIIGPGATANELDDYSDMRKANKRYHRYGIPYRDLSDDVFENFVHHADHRHQMGNSASDNEHTADSDSDNDQQIVIKERNKPSLGQNGHNKHDSGIDGLGAILGK